MASQHGRFTVIIINSVDISQYVKTSEFTREGDVHDNTTYTPTGKGHVYDGGLYDATFTMSGVYDTTAGTGPRGVLRPLADSLAKVTLMRRPEGTGAGKPEDEVQVIVKKYVETSPVNDYIAWSAECQCSGTIDSTAQA